MTSAKKMFGDLPPSSSVHGNDVFGRVLHDQAARRRLARERDLGDALVLSQRLSGLDAETVDDVEDAFRKQMSPISSIEDHDRHRRLLGGLQHDAVAGSERGSELPDRHQDREVPRNDLADDAERLVEVVGDRVVIDLGRSSLPERECSRRNSGNDRWRAACRLRRLADRLAVVDVSTRARMSRFSSIRSAILFSMRARSAGDVAPSFLRFMRGVEREFDVFGRRTRDLANTCCPVIGVTFEKYWPRTGATHLPPMKLS